MGETIADFIARIESEVEEPGHFNEYHQSESTAENQGLPLSLVIDAPNHQNQHLGVPELSPIQCHQFLIDIMDLELEGTHETGRDPSQHEALATPIRDTSMMPVEDPKESTDEFLDMASFWRPNRFSQF
ncbi:hypothetical protein SAMD00023353_0301360 [Rosellinia necatrix]|uniref:Uncharacterized protein n=1 Tax=Rosellinia necatrix TaxID=77044 RepID=A0A1W2TDG8_ROSNE|nr:hypothetical protein SAMD00023353_0301360 [Rosellinia necatrix]